MSRTKSKMGPTLVPTVLRFAIKAGKPGYRQITERVRELILSQALSPKTRLPPIKELSTIWKTNYFTAQRGLMPLINEGLLESRPGRGTFVATNERKIRSVAVYSGFDFLRRSEASFYQALYAALSEELGKLDINTHLFIDPRPAAEQGTVLKAIRDGIKTSEINAVISAGLNSENVKWLLGGLSVPAAVMTSQQHPRSVGLDVRSMVETSLDHLVSKGCRKVGLISVTSSSEPLDQYFIQYAKKLNLTTSKVWVQSKMIPTQSYDEFGFEQFKEIWSHQERPDGILVYPDHIARGVMIAALSKNVRVPEDLHLVMHGVEETLFYCPLQIDWQLFSSVKAAHALIQLIQNQANGIPCKRINLKTELKPCTFSSRDKF